VDGQDPQMVTGDWSSSHNGWVMFALPGSFPSHDGWVMFAFPKILMKTVLPLQEK